MTVYRIVDVCGTLVRDDTTSGFVHWYLAERGDWRGPALRMATARYSPLRLGLAALQRAGGADLPKLLPIRQLQGAAVAEVAGSAARYADWLLAERRVEAVRRLLERTAREGPLVLASSGIEPVVAALARRLGALHVASTLARRDGHYLGRYDVDLTGCKAAALDGVLPAGWRGAGYVAASDNLSDRTLLAGARDAYVVLRTPRQRRRWGAFTATYLDA